MAGFKSAKQWGKTGGRPQVISPKKIQAMREALKSGTSKAAKYAVHSMSKELHFMII